MPLTLGPDGVCDGAGVAQAVSVAGTDQEQVDGSGLEVVQHGAVLLDVVGQGHPAAARRVASNTKVIRMLTLSLPPPGRADRKTASVHAYLKASMT